MVVAALMGAEEFGFGTTVLVTLGCVMARKCHLNTCPMGVATQDPELRKRFSGRPEHVERFMRFLAQEVREYMAELGFRTMDEMIGRTEYLEQDPDIDHWKARTLDLTPLIAPASVAAGAPRRQLRVRDDPPSRGLDHELIRCSAPALERKRPVRLEMPICNVDRAVATTLSGEVVRRFGAGGLPDNTIRLRFTGSAGQSLGAFLAPGITIRVHGDANDYVGKGMSGGTIILAPPPGAGYLAHENVIAGNTVLYGATGGEMYVCGIAGERFAVRNSGALAVVEGVGDHGCEYMTGGVVVVIGRTGNNFAAGMSGGVAYVYDPSELFDTRCNLDMVDLETVWEDEDRDLLRGLLDKHVGCTGSERGGMILDNWDAHFPLFVKVMPIDYRKALERMRLGEDRDTETVSATEEVYPIRPGRG